MRKTVIILLCLLVCVMSCLKPNTSDSGLTQIQMTDISDELNKKIGEKSASGDPCAGMLISNFNLEISDISETSGCTENKKLNDINVKDAQLKTISLKTSNNGNACKYKLELSYFASGTNDICFKGETTIGPGQDNEFQTPTTMVKIKLRYISTGETFEQKISSGSGNTNVTIEAELEDNSSDTSNSCTKQIQNIQKDALFCYSINNQQDCKTWCASLNDIKSVTALRNCDDSFIRRMKELCPSHESTTKVCIHSTTTSPFNSVICSDK